MDQITVVGRRVFVRLDLNVPRDKADPSKILDDTRIREALPTVRHLLEQKAKVILASHLGRPKERRPEDSLEPVAARLAELLDQEVLFPNDCIGDSVKKLSHDLREGQVMLLENLRFHQEEEANDPHFAEQLAQLAEVYVSDAFGTVHRAHASTAGMVRHFKEKGIGFLIRKELEFLEKLHPNPARPYWAVLGGSKVSDKIGLIENLVGKADGLLLGGGLAYTFLQAQGISVGRSKLEVDKVYLAQKILNKAKELDVPVLLPEDHRAAKEFSSNAKARITSWLADDEMGLDIGPATVKKYEEALKQARTIFWNGPMGVFEMPAFAEGTSAIAKAIARETGRGCISVVGGGESAAAVRQAGVAGQVSHISTGGGATLEYLEGRELPGLKALEI